MKSIVLEVLPVAMLVAAEAFLAAFATVWAAISMLGLGRFAIAAGIGFGVIAAVVLTWLVFKLAKRRRMAEG